MRVLPTGWRREPAGIEITSLSRYVYNTFQQDGALTHSSTGDRTIRYDTRCYFNVRSKADISQLNLPHGTDN